MLLTRWLALAVWGAHGLVTQSPTRLTVLRASTYPAPHQGSRVVYPTTPQVELPLVLVGPSTTDAGTLCSKLPCLNGRSRRVRIDENDDLDGADVVMMPYAKAFSRDVVPGISILLNDKSSIENLDVLRDATTYEIPIGPFDEGTLAKEIARIDTLARKHIRERKSKDLEEEEPEEETRLMFGDDTFFLSLTYDDLRTPGPEILREFGREAVPKSCLNFDTPRLNFVFSDRLCRRSKLIILVETFFYFFIFYIF